MQSDEVHEVHKIGDIVMTASLTPGGDDCLQFDDGLLTGIAFDDTGLHRVWPASKALCTWLYSNPSHIRGRRVLELGAGTALPSLLCARHLDVDLMLATDANETAVAKLQEAEPRVNASVVTFDDADAVVSLARAEHIDTILLADVVYPAKDATPLLNTLSRLLSELSVTILFSLTRRDGQVHAAFEERLRALGRVESLGIDAEQADPLYKTGASVFLYCIVPEKASPPGAVSPTAALVSSVGQSTTTTKWRLELHKLRLWPEEPPAGITVYSHGWVHRGNERLLRRLIRERQPRVVVELGCWLGLCTSLILEETAGLGGAVIAVDRWDAQFLLDEQMDQYQGDEEALSILQGTLKLPLYETFLVNLWDHRSRLFPLRMDSLKGIAAIKELGVPVELIYVDASHTTAAVLADIRAAEAAFPDAVICGDDYQWPAVRAAVEQHVDESAGRLQLGFHKAENWWCLENASPHVGADSAEPTPVGSQAGSSRVLGFVASRSEPTCT